MILRTIRWMTKDTFRQAVASKLYWVMLGVDKAFQALEWGVDDLDGTVDDSTKIYSMAGSMQNPTLSSGFLRDEITQRGRLPVERDSLYQPFAGATS